ncbi:MAG: ATP-dependent DNA ligase [Gemmatimonadaceae bacterium]|nr:ATP-dependent DNA ligase [Gemmatimonadaceae bacterium]
MTVPEWLEPMAATLTQERFSGDAWTFERKFDGIRLMAHKAGDDVTLLSRNRLTHHHPTIVAAIRALPASELILDGEAMGVWGKAAAFGYHVFDVLWLDGRAVTGLPLDARRALLDTLPLRPPLVRVEPLDGDAPWERACREGWEGVIAKRRDSIYEHKRSKHWLKMKCEVSQDFVVGGFTDPQGKRAGLGALLVGYYDGDDFVFAGRVGTGFDVALLNALREQLDALAVSASPFTRATGLPRAGHWVRPDVVVRAAFIEWTAHGKLRHSRLLGVRPGQVPREVTRVTG